LVVNTIPTPFSVAFQCDFNPIHEAARNVYFTRPSVVVLTRKTAEGYEV
jgi:hypothetical protein